MVIIPFLTVLFIAVVWKFSQLARDPGNAPLRSVALCLLCGGLSYTVAMPSGVAEFDTFTGHGLAKLVQNLLLMGCCYFLMCFYLYSAADDVAGRRRARREGVALLVVAAVLTVDALSTSQSALAGSYSTADMAIPQTAVFFLLAGGYMAYAAGAAFWWTRRYARMTERPLSTGLWLAAVGLAFMAVSCAIRAAFVVIRNQGGEVPKPLTASVALLLVLASIFFVVGLSYPMFRARIAAMATRRRHKRVHRQLAPLWQLLTKVYPDLVLRPASTSARDRWRARNVHRRYHRRIVECRDGLVRLSPYVDMEETVDAGPSDVATRLREAVQLATSSNGSPVRPVSLTIPAQKDRAADVEQLLRLAAALKVPAPADVPDRSTPKAKESQAC
ncbi:MAB_1171c family putative transporter [Streptomyces sp. NPDC051561]|uniref:MAB_1171c family putative transporter n=1 Tax=Streptomyces sp. NPDC051561 TaxID=3365658 RepID=UPI0037BB7565